jgi:hypothetical protein
MPLKVKTSTGLSEVLDMKVKTADGALTDVQRLAVKQSDGTLATVWERNGVPHPPTPPPPEPLPIGVVPLTLTVNAHDGTFTIPVRNSVWATPWIVDWDDGYVVNATNSATRTHTYFTPGTYSVKIYPTTATTYAWLQTFGTVRGTHLKENGDPSDDTHILGDTAIPDPAVQSNLDKIIGVDGVITPQMVATEGNIAQGKVGDGVCNHWFYGCRNLTMSDTFTFSGWETITEVGGGFCYGMFFGCSGANFTMGAAFNLPQNIQRIGSNGSTYRSPDWYQVPGFAFCSCMFYGCSGASFNMNNVFTLPQTLVMTGAWFCYGMFIGCSGNAFTMGQVFNLPQNITKLQAPEEDEYAMLGHVCMLMFYGCSGNAFTMNSIFQLPQGLVYGQVCSFMQMFWLCSGSAFTMNNIFTLPQAMTDAYSALANGMFNQCHGSGFQVGAAFRFPPLLSQAAVNNLTNLHRVFYCYTNKTYPRQNRTIASIINGLPVPSSARETFFTYDATQGANRWSDYNDPGIDGNWK